MPKDARKCDSCALQPTTANMFGLQEGTVDCSCMGDAPLCSKLVSNYKRHSYLTKFVLSVLPHSHYKGNDLLDRLMAQLCDDFNTLFTQGVDIAGERYFAALVGFKGDLKWYQKIAFLERCFSEQLKADTPMRHERMAGTHRYPFEDTSHSPGWSQSLWHERPWSSSKVPPIAGLCFDSGLGGQKPEKILRRDSFHNVKLGLLREFLGGTIMLLCWLGYFNEPGDTNSRPALLERAHAHFVFYCKTIGKSPALRSFTMLLFNIKTWYDFAWINAKGSDCTLCLGWIRTLTACLQFDLREPGHKRTIEAMHRAACQLERFFQILYSHGLFLPRHCAAAMYEALHSFLEEFNLLSFLSLHCHKYTACGKKSKLHMTAHDKYDLLQGLAEPSEFVLSPLAWAAEMNEDMVGRLSRLSRRCDQRTVSMRSLEMYLIGCKAVYRRYRKTKKIKLKAASVRR